MYARLTIGVLCCAAMTVTATAQPTPPPASRLAAMAYFTGRWSCEGRGPRPWIWTFAPVLDGQAYDLKIVEPKGRSDGADVLVDVRYAYQPATNTVFDMATDNLGRFEINRVSLFDGKSLTARSIQTSDGAENNHVFTVVNPTRFIHHLDVTVSGRTVASFDQTCSKM